VLNTEYNTEYIDFFKIIAAVREPQTVPNEPDLLTSTAFACMAASGSDWRDVGRKILEKIETVRTEEDGMTIGFIYVTQELGPDLTSLLSLLKNVTHIAHWYGASGQGICGNGLSYVGIPAASVMIGRLPANSFHGFALPLNDTIGLPADLRAWMNTHTPVAAITHGVLSASSVARLGTTREREGLYTVGGFAVGSNGGFHIADSAVISEHPLSGVLLDDTSRVLTGTSFGCILAGKVGRVTSCRGNVIETIDNEPAFAFLRRAVDSLKIDENAEPHGHVHAAFPVVGSDTNILLMRNITAADEKTETLSVAHNFVRGDTIQFVWRDRHTTLSDLARTVRNLHARACAETGMQNPKPKAILYFGCGARLPQYEGRPAGGLAEDEAAIIRNVMGDAPMAGFYTAAEICNGHVFGYTGVIVLFL